MKIKRQRRGLQRAALLVGAASVALTLFILTRPPAKPFALTTPRDTAAGDLAPFRIGDRAVITPLQTGTTLVTTAMTRRAVFVRLEAGSARFQVRRALNKPFHVDAGPVEITVIGTQFIVARHAKHVDVKVERGMIRVFWTGGSRTMKAGATARFPPKPERRSVDKLPTVTKHESPSLHKPPEPPELPKRPESRRKPMRPAPPAETVDGLLAQADGLRLSARHADAVPFLRRALAKASGAQHKAVIAFSLGRLLIDHLGRFGQAARAFALVCSLAPTNPLAEDALAREVEALAKSGALASARSRAAVYLARYPRGRRRALVRRYGVGE